MKILHNFEDETIVKKQPGAYIPLNRRPICLNLSDRDID